MAQMGIIPRTRIETPDSVTWRKHWIFLALGAAPALILSIGLGIATCYGLRGLPEGLVAWLPQYPYLTLLLTALAMAWFWWQCSDWANDLYIVTDTRVIDIEKRPLFFAQERREASLGMIQNVSLSIPNPLARIINYGYVLVQTAGSGDFTFDRVANPREVQREVFRRLEQFRETQRQKEAARRRAELGEWFTVYDNLRQGEGTIGQRPSAPERDEPDASSRPINGRETGGPSPSDELLGQ